MTNHPASSRSAGNGATWLLSMVILAVAVGITATGAPSRAAAGQSPVASPVDLGEPDQPGALASMLRLAPDPGTASPETEIATYADLAGQFAAVGVAVPRAADAAGMATFRAVTQPLYLPAALADHGLEAAWRETFGFDLLQVDQAMLVGQPPAVTTLVRGRFDRGALQAAWARSGYREVAVDLPGATVASFREDETLVLTSPVGRLALNATNNAAILPDGTLAFAASLPRLRAVLAVARGGAPSLAERPTVATLLAATTDDLVSAVLAAGTTLRPPPEDAALVDRSLPPPDVVATEAVELRRMRPVQLVLLGITGGGPVQGLRATAATPPAAGSPPARFRLVLLLSGDAAAEEAAAVVRERLAMGRSLVSGRSYVSLFPAGERRVEAAVGAPVLVVDLGLAEGERPDLGFALFSQRDLGFVAWT